MPIQYEETIWFSLKFQIDGFGNSTAKRPHNLVYIGRVIHLYGWIRVMGCGTPRGDT